MNQVKLPANSDELKLIHWIGFFRTYGAELDRAYATLPEMEEGPFKQLQMADHNLDRLYSMTAYFLGIHIDEAERIYTIEEVSEFNNTCFSKWFEHEADTYKDKYTIDGVVYNLPPPELHPGSTMTFGEFIDSKVVMQNAKATELSKWELLYQLAAIFLRKDGEAYNDSFVQEDTQRFKDIGRISIADIHEIGSWFEDLNGFLNENFQIFKDSPIKSGINISKHFENWGWINFLASIAKTKIFDIPNSGLNSIECARIAPLIDVLVYASQEKGYNEAMYADMEAQNRRK